MNSVLGTAIVTGASAGIGRVYADRLARRGYDLILIARRGDRLAAAKAELNQTYGVDVATIVADLSAHVDLNRVATQLARDERIALLVNNAGTSTLGPSVSLDDGDMAAMTGVNIVALRHLTSAVLPGFVARNNGTIVNIGSVLGFHSLPISTVYSATKSFVLTFTRGLQQELADTNVRVQLVLPSATATDIWDISGVPLSALDPATVMSPEDCVDAALSGLDQGELITMPSVEDVTLLQSYDAARLALFAGSRSGKPATRYLATAGTVTGE
jgi:short-subunit dehydrogenase